MSHKDFQYMYRGKRVSLLPAEDIGLLRAVHYKSKQQNRALLLLHGFSSSPAVYRQLLPLLTMYDTIECPTLPGHGESIDAFSSVAANDWVACAEQTCSALMASHQSVDVMGLSLGGVLACHLSNRFSLNHLFLLAPALSLCLNIPLTLMAARLGHALGLRRIPNRAGNLYTADFPELTYRQMPIKTVIEILTFIKTFPWKAPTCPTDVFLGRHDEVVNSEKIAARFANLPNTQVHWLEHSAHILPLDGDREEIIACIQRLYPTK